MISVFKLFIGQVRVIIVLCFNDPLLNGIVTETVVWLSLCVKYTVGVATVYLTSINDSL